MVVTRLPPAVASLVKTGTRVHQLQWLWLLGLVTVAPRLCGTGSVVTGHRLYCSVACGVFLDQLFSLFSPLNFLTELSLFQPLFSTEFLH